MKVKIINLETMLQTVFVSSRTDIAGERVQDGRSGD